MVLEKERPPGLGPGGQLGGVYPPPGSGRWGSAGDHAGRPGRPRGSDELTAGCARGDGSSWGRGTIDRGGSDSRIDPASFI